MLVRYDVHGYCITFTETVTPRTDDRPSGGPHASREGTRTASQLRCMPSRRSALSPDADACVSTHGWLAVPVLGLDANTTAEGGEHPGR